MDFVFNINTGIAFVFGVISFFSPCVLPLLPGYFSLLLGGDGLSGNPSRRKAFINGLGFVFGFTVIFVAMGAAASSAGRLLLEHQAVLTRLAGVLIIIFGLHISEILPLKILMRSAGGPRASSFAGWPGGFLLGMTFSIGWTPCVGPILASILVLAGNSATLKQGIILLGVYSLGLGLPFLLAALSVGTIFKWMKKANAILPYVNAVSGGLLIAVGILFLLGLWNRIVSYLL